MQNTHKRPRISVVVVLYNMRREAARTLHSLSVGYQLEMPQHEYEVHVVENGSQEPVEERWVRSFGANFHYHRLADPPPSPAFAMNYGARQARGQQLVFMIDGAHLLTPRVLTYMHRLTRGADCPIIAVHRFFLGPGQQTETVGRGYSQRVEDRLLKRIRWPYDPYQLFEISSFMGPKRRGWFSRLWESNCLAMPRHVFEAIGGCNERFDIPGGGFLNLDLLVECLAYPGAQLHVLLGEGSFHQVHGGTTTNVSVAEKDRRVAAYHRQYEAIRGRPYEVPKVEAELFGTLHPRCFLV